MATPRITRQYSMGPMSNSKTTNYSPVDKGTCFLNRRRLSATDLLNYNLGPTDQLFPLINAETYQVKASHSIYQIEDTDTTEEIATYLEKKCSYKVPFEGVVGCRISNTSLTSITEHEEINQPVVLNESIVYDIQNDHGDDSGRDVQGKREHYNYVEGENKNHERHNIRRTSAPVFFTDGVTKLQNMTYYTSNRRTSCVSTVWFGCRMEFMPVSQRLKIQLHKEGHLMCEVTQGKQAKLFGKVCILPGNIQKQCLEVRSPPTNKSAVYFTGISKLDLCRMNIGVKIYMRRGLIKRPKLIHEWSIELDSIALSEPQTAWKKVDFCM